MKEANDMQTWWKAQLIQHLCWSFNNLLKVIIKLKKLVATFQNILDFPLSLFFSGQTQKWRKKMEIKEGEAEELERNSLWEGILDKKKHKSFHLYCRS